MEKCKSGQLEVFKFRIPVSLRDELRQLSSSMGLTPSALVRTLLIYAIRTYPWKQAGLEQKNA